MVSASNKEKQCYTQGYGNVKHFVIDRVLLKIHFYSEADKGIKAKFSLLYKGPYPIRETKTESIYVLDMGASKHMNEAHVSGNAEPRQGLNEIKGN